MLQEKDLELVAMSKIREALDPITDESVRIRVLGWAKDRYIGKAPVNVDRNILDIFSGFNSDNASEMEGIAQKTEKGVEITIRDLKAKNKIEAALRLALISIYAHEKLTKEKGVSSRKFLAPILQDWRLYDGNSRHMLANHRGILRDGDELSLDSVARKEAEKYINDILNPEVKGAWDPFGRTYKTGNKLKSVNREKVK